jgi:hypothetical protein
MRRVFASAVLLALLAGPVAAQVRIVRYGDDRLTGIAAVDVLVSGSFAEGACRLSRDTIVQIARRELAAQRIVTSVSAKARSSPYSVVVDLRTAESAGTCGTSLNSQLVAEVSATPEADTHLPPGAWGSLLVGGMGLISENALVLSPALDHDAHVQRALVNLIGGMATRIRTANP